MQRRRIRTRRRKEIVERRMMRISGSWTRRKRWRGVEEGGEFMLYLRK